MFSLSRTPVGRVLAVGLSALLFSPALPRETPPKGSGTSLETARLSGKIFAADGKTPVEGAVVRLHFLDGDRVVESPGTDDDGEFEIEGLPHGYADLVVASGEDLFVGSRFVALPPSGKVRVRVSLARREDRSETWWAAKVPLELPRGGGSAAGIADLDTSLRGRDFWKSPAGIAVLAAAGGALLLAITIGGRDDDPDPTTVP